MWARNVDWVYGTVHHCLGGRQANQEPEANRGCLVNLTVAWIARDPVSKGKKGKEESWAPQ